MSSLVASVATRVASAADFVAHTVAPVDDGGAPPGTYSNDGFPGLLRKSAQDIHNLVVKGRPFSLADLPAYIDALNLLRGQGIDDRKFLLEKILTLMSRLPSDDSFGKTLQASVIGILYKDLPHPPAAYLPTFNSSALYSYSNVNIPFSTAPSSPVGTISNGLPNIAQHINVHADNDQVHTYKQPIYNAQVPYSFRSADGSGYNPLYPNMGKAGVPYARTVPSTTPALTQSLPDPGLLFDTLLARPNCPTPKFGPMPATDQDGFADHPGGISSLFFAFANLIIHSCFNTDHGDWSINNASSYLDLSPLYGSGSSAGENNKVRRFDGTGRLWEDVFADARILFMPPNVCALLVLFCRNHNYIARKLLSINEWGYYTPTSTLDALSSTERRAQDEELYQRARLVNCGFFMQIILGDYVGAILGLQRDGLDWRLDPLASSRELNHTVSSRGEGNVVSVEFNLLYRWHAALSKPDTQWTEQLFQSLFNTNDYKSITVDQFQTTLAQKFRPDPDVTKWSFQGVNGQKLERDSNTGAFDSAELAAILQNATGASASSFKARGIPEVMRIIEIMGIEQSRRWGTCTMNEFRKFMGLKEYETFAEWNPDPRIYKAAELLYRHIDNLELHVGLQAEEIKEPMPGAGLCPGYTISRAILADAVALTRGDPFLTTEFTVYNLTSWGYQDCFPEKNDGSYGGMLTRLLYRTLPGCYPPGSVYAHFPFMVPEKVKGYLAKLVDSPVSSYSFMRPPVPLPVEVVESFKGVRGVLDRKDVFESPYKGRLLKLTKGINYNVQLVNDILNSFNSQAHFSNVLGHITEQLIKEKSFSRIGSPMKYVDIVKDVLNLVPIYFIATELAGLPIKTDQTPHGAFRDTDLHDMFKDVSNYVFLNNDPYMDWVLRERSLKTSEIIIGIIEEHLKRLSKQNVIAKVTDSFIQWYSGEAKFSDSFLKKVLTSTNSRNLRQIASSIFVATISTAALYSKAIVEVVAFFLEDEQREAFTAITSLLSRPNTNNDTVLYKYAREALRLNPPVPSVMRTTKSIIPLPDGDVLKLGQSVFCSINAANHDKAFFGPNPSIPNFMGGEYGLLAMEEYGLTNDIFFKATIPRVLRAVFALKGLQRTSGTSGSLNRITELVHGLPETVFVDSASQTTPWPVSLIVQYDI